MSFPLVVLEKLVADQQQMLAAMEAKQVELEQLIGATKVELESAGERNKVLAAGLDQLQVKCDESERAQVLQADRLDRVHATQVYIHLYKHINVHVQYTAYGG